MDKPPLMFGPTVDVLKAFCWKICCPPKIKHFLWQLVTWFIAVKKNLQTRGIHGDICCARCGADEESINHVFFECPPTLQVWALSKIPSNPTIFPTSSLFTNMDHLFWRVFPQMDDHQFAWILWYIWKWRNNKIKFLVIWTLTPRTRLIWQKQNQHFGLRHIYWTNRGMYDT